MTRRWKTSDLPALRAAVARARSNGDRAWALWQLADACATLQQHDEAGRAATRSAQAYERLGEYGNASLSRGLALRSLAGRGDEAGFDAELGLQLETVAAWRKGTSEERSERLVAALSHSGTWPASLDKRCERIAEVFAVLDSYHEVYRVRAHQSETTESTSGPEVALAWADAAFGAASRCHETCRRAAAERLLGLADRCSRGAD